MDRKILRILLILLVIPVASASFIRMTTNIYLEPVVHGTSTTVNVSVVNSGDEPAHDVELSLVLPEGFSSNKVYLGNMQPNLEYNANFHVNITPGAKSGRYPLILKLHYADANAYPFSVVSPSFLMYEESTPIMVRGFMSEITLGTEGEREMRLKMSNLDSKAHAVRVRMVTPDEIKVDPRDSEIPLGGNEEKEVLYKIKSFGALAESSYVIFATMEYDDSLHYSSLANGMVKVVSGGQSSVVPSWLPFAAVVILIALLIYYQLKK